jgi:hypothetical protein
MGIVLKMFPDQTSNVARTIKGKTYAPIPRKIVHEGISSTRAHAKHEVGDDVPWAANSPSILVEDGFFLTRTKKMSDKKAIDVSFQIAVLNWQSLVYYLPS